MGRWLWYGQLTVNPPLGKRRGIDLLVAERTCVPTASISAFGFNLLVVQFINYLLSLEYPPASLYIPSFRPRE
jgi:hypothetical protein